MHEAKLCLSLIDLAVTHWRAQAKPAERIRAVRLAVGTRCGVVPEALAAAFPVCAHGTPVEGARLEIERTDGRDLVLRDLEVG
ncbi:MAG: hydrogenase maturation nickel metallochaperone HypA [Myxococcota bacterium]|nr:hydrogenase maturation nickel metallochaperone HypA [Myxococcota bacterium]